MADLNTMRYGGLIIGYPVATPAFSNHTVDASTEGVAFNFQALDANAITHVGFRYGARTGSGAISYILGLETPSVTTGFPDGTYLGGGSPASGVFTPATDSSIDDTWQWVALDNAYTPTRGQRMCITLRYNAGVTASEYSTITTLATNLVGSTLQSFPYALRNTAGTWATGAGSYVFGVRTASTRYGTILESFYNTRSASTVGHRQALEFVVPSGVTTSFTVRGMRFSGSIASAASKAPVFGLWDSGGVIQNVTLDSDVVVSAANGYRIYEVYFDETSLTALTPGTTYYCGLQVADAANGGVLINGIVVDGADDLLAHPGGTAWRLATFDGSSWTSDTTTRPMAELILGDMTATGGGGGAAMLINSGGLVG